MVKFIQTSDWQIGMKGSGLEKAGSIVRNERINSIHAVLKEAQDRRVDFVLMCGDIFEHNMIDHEIVKKVVTIFNQYGEIPMFILPGNHDVLGADCIYNRDIFERIDHLKILRTNESVEAPNAILHPCPVLSKFTKEDLTANIPVVRETDGIHIAIAHGSVVGKFPVSNWEDIVLPVEPSCIERTGVDYLALGHWHSKRFFKDSTGTVRIVYSGTHEQTKYDEDDAGQCLLVQIDEKGAVPKIVAIKTGNLSWESKQFEIKDISSLNELKKYLESIRGADLVRLDIHGELPLEHKEELDQILEFQSTLHKDLRVKTEFLTFSVTPALDSEFDFADPTLIQTQKYLKNLLENETNIEKRNVIVEALTHLHKFVEESNK